MPLLQNETDTLIDPSVSTDNDNTKLREESADGHNLEQEQRSPLISSDSTPSCWADLCFKHDREDEQNSHGTQLVKVATMGVKLLVIGGKAAEADWDQLREEAEEEEMLREVPHSGDIAFVRIAEPTTAIEDTRTGNLIRPDPIWDQILHHCRCRTKIIMKQRPAKRRILESRLRRMEATVRKRLDSEKQTKGSERISFLKLVFRSVRRLVASWRLSSSRSRFRRRFKGIRKTPSNPTPSASCTDSDSSEQAWPPSVSYPDEDIQRTQQKRSSPEIVQLVSSPTAADQEDISSLASSKSTGRYLPPHLRGEPFGGNIVRRAEARRKSHGEKAADELCGTAFMYDSWRKSDVNTGTTEPTAKENWRYGVQVKLAYQSKIRPGFIAWLPNFDTVPSFSILHTHEDFGRNELGRPAGAYGHPTLVYEMDEDDDTRCICLKITSWSSTLNKEKWDPNSPVAQTRRALYMPLTGTNPDLKKKADEMDMPTLTFEGGGDMPPKDECGKSKPNESYVNIERVFLIEKANLHDFKINRKVHRLYLTENALEEIAHYRVRKDRKRHDKGTLERQRQIFRAAVPPVQRRDSGVQRSYSLERNRVTNNWREQKGGREGARVVSI
jgi:hypothetical protein